MPKTQSQSQWLNQARISSSGPVAPSLLTLTAFGVLAGSTITNTGPTTITGDLGLDPGSSVTGAPTVTGSSHVNDAAAIQAKTDLVTLYNYLAGLTNDFVISGDIGGTTKTPGVYTSASSIGITGTLTLDAQGDASAIFVIRAGSTIVTAPSAVVSLINGADAKNVFWLVGSSATLDSATTFKGTIVALTSITLVTGATILDGRALARNGAVTMDTNLITAPGAPSAGGGAGTTSIPVLIGRWFRDGSERVAAGRAVRLCLKRDRDGTAAALNGTIAVYGKNLPAFSGRNTANQGMKGDSGTVGRTVFTTTLPYVAFTNYNWVVLVINLGIEVVIEQGTGAGKFQVSDSGGFAVITFGTALATTDMVQVAYSVPTELMSDGAHPFEDTQVIGKDLVWAKMTPVSGFSKTSGWMKPGSNAP